MKFTDMLRICYQDLTCKKSRTLLTVIGVIAGVCAVLLMSSIGLGMKKNQEKLLSEMGDLKQITIYNYNDQKPIDEEVLARWEKLPGVKALSPIYTPDSLQIKFYAKNKRYMVEYLNLVGVRPGFLEKMGFTYIEEPKGKTSVKAGKEKAELSASPLQSTKLTHRSGMGGGSFLGRRVISGCVGEAFAYAFVDTMKKEGNNQVIYEKDEAGNPIKPAFVDLHGDRISLALQIGEGEQSKEIVKDFQVDGRLKENSGKLYQSYNGVFLDIDTVREMERMASPKEFRKKKKNYNQVIVLVNHINDAEAVEKAIKEDGYDTNSLVETRKSFQKNRQQQMQMLYSTSLLAVFVAAISIMNTMIMSVSERTKEIGVMKVLGCYVSDIRRLFLLESATIGAIGGVLGIGLSYLLSFLLNRFGSSLVPNAAGTELGIEGAIIEEVSVLPPILALGGLVFAILIGAAAGFLPANRAVKISAIEAMKA